MAIIKDKFVFYELELSNGKSVTMQDVARTDISEYPKVALNIRPYDEYEELAKNLKSCPFCGSPAEKIFVFLKYENVSPLWSNTKCSNRECLCSSKDVDAKVWNKRMEHYCNDER